MAVGDDPNIADDPSGASGGPPVPGGQPPGLPAPSGGRNPMLAALAGQQNQPQVTAPGQGNQGDALMKLKAALDVIAQVLPSLGVGTPAYIAAADTLKRLGKHVPAGAQTIGVQGTMLENMQRDTKRNALLAMLMQQQQAQQQQPPGGQPPMPSTPMPT